jgi:membrane-bound lytic murein transglycosylase A
MTKVVAIYHFSCNICSDMKQKIYYSSIIALLLSVCFIAWYLKPDNIRLKQSSFAQLPGWQETDIKKSLAAFQVSCKTFLRQDPEHTVGSQQIHLQVKDWLPACKAAMTITPISDGAAKIFFQTWFRPVEFYNRKSVSGLFTGYYLPLLEGSLTKSLEYNIPIYGLPTTIINVNLANFDTALGNQKLIGRIENNKLLPFYTRQHINNGALENKAPVLVWVKSHIDRLFLEIQGSGIVRLPNNERLYLGYAGENGASYTAIGSVLVKQGVMSRKTASMQRIRAYLEAHPNQIMPIINRNKSFVFFKILAHSAAMGAQGVPLTPGYSLAVDRKWIPLGTPLWLDTTRPDLTSDTPTVLQRLMIAQDTGGAIRGTVRGDVFWGAGKQATFIAGNMKNEGHYWLLLPRHRIANLPKRFA